MMVGCCVRGVGRGFAGCGGWAGSRPFHSRPVHSHTHAHTHTQSHAHTHNHQVKAWCYYESRLLGAHHGLISSYALEAMVLHVFNRHHAALRTPFEVLRRFLEVYSGFGWEEAALTLQGPVPLASFPHPTGAWVGAWVGWVVDHRWVGKPRR